MARPILVVFGWSAALSNPPFFQLAKPTLSNPNEIMKYFSTRSQNEDGILSFEDVVMRGLAPDGGLYIPRQVPHLSMETILSWKDLSFCEIAFNIFRLFIAESEIPSSDLKRIVDASFATFSHPDVTPVTRLPQVGEKVLNLWLLELFHGPTFAFKDVALQFLGNLFEYFLERRNRGLLPEDPTYSRLTVLGATSGDTGGAAIYGLRGKKNVQVFILHPQNRISPVQELQMTSVLDMNVHNIALEGTFDDCQDIVKALFGKEDIRTKFSLGAINSINWGRILAQISYYFFSYFSVLKQTGIEPSNLQVQYSVPTGNFGDILAGFYAQKLGLPVHKLIIATNANDILHRFLETGRYDKYSTSSDSADPVAQTLSPAMDILVSSNFERVLYYLLTESSHALSSQESTNTIRNWMEQLKLEGGFAVPSHVLDAARRVFASGRVDDEATSETIGRYYHSSVNESERTKTILDPHTAVGVKTAETLLSTPVPSHLHTVCLSTASPGKFPDAVLSAINRPDSSTQISFETFAPKPLVELLGKPQRMVIVKTKGDKASGIASVLATLEGTLQL